MRRLGAVAALSLVLAGVPAAASHAAALAFDLRTNYAPPGTLVTLTGTGCPDLNTYDPDGTVWFGNDSAFSPVNVPVDSLADGSFGATFVTPRVSNGDYLVHVTCGAVTADQPLEVDWNPDYVLPRFAGADRYATAAALSSQVYAPGVRAAFVASGENFPDALAGAPAAASLSSPVLLTRHDVLPTVTATELRRLKPRKIIVLGGTVAVSAAVAAKLTSLGLAPVVRWAGADRYETAYMTATNAFEGIPDLTAFVASGENFPDALSGASVGAPLLLTQRTVLPAITVHALRNLRAQTGVIVGGTGVVAPAVATQLTTAVGDGVVRVGGADRYATSALFADEYHQAPSTRVVLFVASGQTYPDALAAAAVAGMTSGALLLTQASSLPAPVITEIKRIHPANIVVVGGRAAVSDAVVDSLRSLLFITH